MKLYHYIFVVKVEYKNDHCNISIIHICNILSLSQKVWWCWVYTKLPWKRHNSFISNLYRTFNPIFSLFIGNIIQVTTPFGRKSHKLYANICLSLATKLFVILWYAFWIYIPMSYDILLVRLDSYEEFIFFLWLRGLTIWLTNNIEGCIQYLINN